ncbi:MAG: type III glutamate--ammonia ligase [Burkholderiales bacterium]|nr:type III glutamate--ammonia ligase [Burkholderiales bacterium]
MNPAALGESLHAAGVHTLLVQFTDLRGVAKGKLVPLHQLGAVLRDGAGFAGPSIEGSGLPRSGPRSEFWARGDASTVQPLPWWPGVARIVGDGFVDGRPFDACPRQVLRRARARLAERGWRLECGIEPEFFLLRRDGDRWLPADDADRLDKPSYDLKSLPRQAGFLHALREVLEACGTTVLQTDHEDAWGQYEINFAHAEALASADRLMLFKLAAHALAEARGMVLSMMPKPFADQPGSGMHWHVSLWDGAHNLFAGSDGALSALGRAFVAGVLAHAPALAAIGAPTVNSYKRLRVGRSRSGTSWAPVFVAHGANNRTALVRTLPDRFEWRLPDAAANPYLVSATLIAAGLDGIDRGLDPGPGIDDDLFAMADTERAARGLARLPRSLEDAADALQADAAITQALGDELGAELLRLHRAESEDWAGHVSGWERARYAAAF